MSDAIANFESMTNTVRNAGHTVEVAFVSVDMFDNLAKTLRDKIVQDGGSVEEADKQIYVDDLRINQCRVVLCLNFQAQTIVFQ
jgi:hypothetical protein